MDGSNGTGRWCSSSSITGIRALSNRFANSSNGVICPIATSGTSVGWVMFFPFSADCATLFPPPSLFFSWLLADCVPARCSSDSGMGELGRAGVGFSGGSGTTTVAAGKVNAAPVSEGVTEVAEPELAETELPEAGTEVDIGGTAAARPGSSGPGIGWLISGAIPCFLADSSWRSGANSNPGINRRFALRSRETLLPL